MDTTTIKASLGITSTTFDSEITANISAALADMGYTTDITNLEETDALIIKAVTTYCAWQHNLFHGNMELADKFKESYDQQKATLLMASEYTTYDEDEDE